MTEAAQNNQIEESVIPPAIETSESQEAPQDDIKQIVQEAKDQGVYNAIDVKTATPEQIEARYNYLFRQVKHSERDKREMQNILRQQSEIISRLEQGQNAVIGHLTQKSFVDGKEQAKKDMQDAWKRQDNEAYIEAQNRLMDIQVEERIAQRETKSQPQQQAQTKSPQSATDVAYNATQTGELSQEDYRVTEAWQNEKDDMGNVVRPWAFATDPTHQAALFEARSVMANPRYEAWTYQQKLEEIDRRMGTAKRTASRAVVGGGLTKGTKSTKIELTPKQREIALKTHYAGKGKSEADHLDAYRKQIEKFQQKKV